MGKTTKKRKVIIMKRILLLFLVAVLALGLVGCSSIKDKIGLDKKVDPVKEEFSEPEVEEKKVEEPIKKEEAPVVVAEPKGCTNSNQCDTIAQKCVEGECKTVASLYKTDCDDKCNFNAIIVETSDKETLTLSRGKGSYSYAGAIAWKLLPGPNYCPGDEKVIVPIQLTKKAPGMEPVVEVIVAHPGEKSDMITHPKYDSLKFTLTVKSLTEECGKS